MFLVVEGIDGAGKSTVAAAIVRRLQELGRSVVALREPGSTPVGEHVRSLLLDPATGDLDAWTEACLFTACRAELVRRRIRPALELGHDVVLDRYFFSTVAYQGHAGGADPVRLTDLNLRATGGLLPDRVLLLDLEPAAALARLQRGHDRMEGKGLGFLTAVRRGYLAQAAVDPSRWQILPAAAPADRVLAAAWSALEPLIAPGPRER